MKRRARRETSEEIGAFRQSVSVCVCVCFGCGESIHLSVPHTVPLSARQSPCQFSGLHAPPVRAYLGPQTEPLCGLRLDLVADQWDLGGQTDCHSIVPCMLPNLNLFVALPISAIPAWILTRTGTAGGKKKICAEGFFSVHVGV